jgi:hypothetical protein
MQCPQCQRETVIGAAYCDQCGAPLQFTRCGCGELNKADAKFCRKCGLPLVSPFSSRLSHFTSPESYTPPHLIERILTAKFTIEGERKQVTILFADIRESMELIADRDPEDARQVLDPVLILMMDAVHHLEGTVCQVMGDGIMGIFGAPIAHEDHAIRACRAALHMQESIERFANDLRTRQGKLAVAMLSYLMCLTSAGQCIQVVDDERVGGLILFDIIIK